MSRQQQRHKTEFEWTSFCGRPERAKAIRDKDVGKFAFVTLLFPNPANKAESPYMVGNIATALALRRQNTRADLVCLITPDVDPDTVKALEMVYDRVVVGDYIRPHVSVINTFRESYLNMFTKLHVFDPRLFPYKKVCLIDSDIIPLRNYDALFDVQTPAGILEPSRGDSYGDDYGFSGRCAPKVRHGARIPKEHTDIWLPHAGDINAGLWVIEPNLKEFKDMLREIARPSSEWIKPGSKYAGYYDHSTGEVNYHFTWPEQQYLTSRYSGQWHSVGYEFASWCVRPTEMNGVHYVPFEKMPWMDTFGQIKRLERYHPESVECLQMFFVVMFEGLLQYPALAANPRFAKYASRMMSSLKYFARTEIAEGVLRFKMEKNWK